MSEVSRIGQAECGGIFADWNRSPYLRQMLAKLDTSDEGLRL
jgi:hypothetical protein